MKPNADNCVPNYGTKFKFNLFSYAKISKYLKVQINYTLNFRKTSVKESY